MIRWIFKMFYLFASIISIIIICKIFAGQTYTRNPPSELVCNNKSKVSESWPFKMRLRMTNHMCSTPDPNVDVSEESVIAAWHLPPKSRLSSSMRLIGRCQLVAAEMVSKGIEFDTSQCICVNSWPILALCMVIFCMLFNVHRLIFGFSVDKSIDTDTGGGSMRLYLVACIPFMAWLTVLILVATYKTDVMDIGLTYTTYGHMYPTSYYDKSIEWKSIFNLVTIIYFVNGFECLVCALVNCGCCVATKSWIIQKVKILIAIPSRAQVVVKEKYPL